MSIGNFKTTEKYLGENFVSFVEMEPTTSRKLDPVSSDGSFLQLENIVKKLENITDKLAGTSYPDSYEDFGKVIALLLRELPGKDINSLKTKLLTIVFRERRKNVSVKRKWSISSSRQSTKDQKCTVENKIARGLTRKVLNGTSSPTNSTVMSSERNSASLQLSKDDDLTKDKDVSPSKEKTSNIFENNHSHTSSRLFHSGNSDKNGPISLETNTDALAKTHNSLLLSSSHLNIPTSTVSDHDVNTTLNFTGCVDIHNDIILEESKKETLPVNDSLPSTSDLKPIASKIYESPENSDSSSKDNSLSKRKRYEQKTLNTSSPSIRKFGDIDIYNTRNEDGPISFKLPLRTYKTIKKKKSDYSVLNGLSPTPNESKTITLKSSVKDDTLGSITLPSTPNDKYIVNLQPFVKEDSRSCVNHEFSNSVLSSDVLTASERGPENCLMDVESAHNAPTQCGLSDNHGLQPTEMVFKCEVEDIFEPNQSDSLLSDQMEFKCEEEEINYPNQSESLLFTDELEVKYEEDLDESNPCNNCPSTEEITTEDTKFETVFCGDTDPEIALFTENVSCTSESMEVAMQAVKSDGGKNWETVQFCTLLDRCHDIKLGKNILGRRPIFTKTQENEISQQVLAMAKIFYGISKSELRRLVFEYAETNNIIHHFSAKLRMAGVDWVKGFLKRNPIITLRKPEPTRSIRVLSFNSSEVKQFYTNLKLAMDKHSFQPSNIYNYDETVMLTVYKHGSKQDCLFSNLAKKENMTACCAVSAAGTYLPPMLISPMLRKSEIIKNDGQIKAIYQCSKNGLINEELFLVWLDHFVATTKPSEESPVLLIMDNHIAHTTLTAYKKCMDNNIIIISIPPHTSHRLHPLGVTFYSNLRAAFSQEYDSYIAVNPSKNITFNHIIYLFNKAYIKVADNKHGEFGFLDTGIFPLDTNRFTEDSFVITLVEARDYVNNVKICESSLYQSNNQEISETTAV